MIQQRVKYFRIGIKVEPYVKKYVESIYGEFMVISMKNPASMVIYGFLTKKNMSVLPEKQENIDSKSVKLTSSIYIGIQRKDTYRHGIYVNPKAHFMINRFFAQRITENIHILANSYQSIGKTRVEAIENFCKLYNIEIDEDVSMDALKKNDYRFGENIKEIQEQKKVFS